MSEAVDPIRVAALIAALPEATERFQSAKKELEEIQKALDRVMTELRYKAPPGSYWYTNSAMNKGLFKDSFETQPSAQELQDIKKKWLDMAGRPPLKYGK